VSSLGAASLKKASAPNGCPASCCAWSCA
jgi:hypothetical protein